MRRVLLGLGLSVLLCGSAAAAEGVVRDALAEDGRLLDTAKVPPDVFAVNQ